MVITAAQILIRCLGRLLGVILTMARVAVRVVPVALMVFSTASAAMSAAFPSVSTSSASTVMPYGLTASGDSAQDTTPSAAEQPSLPPTHPAGSPRVSPVESPTPKPAGTPRPLPTVSPTTKPAGPTPARAAGSPTPQPTATRSGETGGAPASETSRGKAPQFLPPTDIAFKSLGYGDATVYGVYATLDLYLPGAGGYPLAEGGYVRLILSHAGILLGDRSTMIVRMNDVPLVTVRLNADNTNRTELKVSLPKDKLLDTLNHLKLEFYMRIAEGTCTDELNNPALNATIYGESMIHYAYASLVRKAPTPPPSLADYPQPFVYPSYSWPDELVFVVPDDPSEAELTSASSIAAKLGQMAKGKIITATLTTSSRLDQATREGYNLFFVGKAQSLALPPELRQKASLDLTEDVVHGTTSLQMGGTQLSPDSGAISLSPSPWNPRNWVLVATGATDQAVRRAGTALSTKTYLDAIKGDQAVITQEPRPSALLADDDPGLPKEATLSQLGVSDILVTGLGELKGSSIFFSSPAPNPTDSAYVDLVISHSPLLITSESSLRVELNGTSVKSIQLDDSNTGPTKIRVLFPYTIVKPGANSLSFRLTLFGQSIEACGPVDRSRAWAVVQSQSLIHLPPSGPEPRLSLDVFPYPFLGTGPHLESAYLERNALVLPDDPAEWRDFLQLATALGSYATADTLTLPSMTVRTMPDGIRKERNVIAYGTWGANPLAGEAGASLPLQLESDQGRTFSLPSQETISVSDIEPIALMETIPSPWNAKKALLIVSGTPADTLPWASSALAKGLARGNLSTVTRGDQVNTFSLVKTTLLPRPSGLGLTIPSIAAMAVGFLILCCIAAIAFEPLFRKRKESREAQ
ncbi:MAG: cellulose biosynthesis cyclic di-GMP-binding regulatory protein BcsB [Dehalococcoidia bacterium]|nr:cellulose biosynthesis cyclic di-GMP-binding regulatory protein BcsB [Dehalococcoidia bacterium]